MNCKKCGAQIEEGMRFCPECGGEQQPEETKTTAVEVPAAAPAAPSCDCKTKKSRKSLCCWLSWLIALVILVGIFLLLQFGIRNYGKAVGLADSGNFIAADDQCGSFSVGRILDRNFDEYIKAGFKLESGDYAEARDRFEKLGSYRNAEQFYVKAAVESITVAYEAEGNLEIALQELSKLSDGTNYAAARITVLLNKTADQAIADFNASKTTEAATALETVLRYETFGAAAAEEKDTRYQLDTAEGHALDYLTLIYSNNEEGAALAEANKTTVAYDTLALAKRLLTSEDTEFRKAVATDLVKKYMVQLLTGELDLNDILGDLMGEEGGFDFSSILGALLGGEDGFDFSDIFGGGEEGGFDFSDIFGGFGGGEEGGFNFSDIFGGFGGDESGFDSGSWFEGLPDANDSDTLGNPS